MVVPAPPLGVSLVPGLGVRLPWPSAERLGPGTTSLCSVLRLPIRRLDPDLPLPQAMRLGDAAIDLPARVDITIEPGSRALVPTGFAVALPQGWCGLVLPRSGLALEHGLTVLNTPGLIDAGYRGELQVILVNHGDQAVSIERAQRIAQFLVQPVPPVELVEVDELPEAIDDRGEQGFGSSG